MYLSFPRGVFLFKVIKIKIHKQLFAQLYFYSFHVLYHHLSHKSCFSFPFYIIHFNIYKQIDLEIIMFTLHAKMRSIKDRNGMDFTEAEDIKKWQEYTEELYKKIFITQIITMVWSTHLEPDILECEFYWALGSITTNKANRGDGIPGELLQILKDDAVKMLHSICQHIWKTAVATGLQKASFHSNHKERQCQRMLKLLNNYTHLTH